MTFHRNNEKRAERYQIVKCITTSERDTKNDKYKHKYIPNRKHE